MEKQVYDLQTSEKLAHVMPPLQDVELDLLTQSLVTEGCRDPLVVWNGVVVDGHNRYRICRENNIPFSYIEIEFENESAAKRWIIRNQLARRNVPDFVRCELVLPFEAELRAEAKKRQGQRNDLKNIFPNQEQSAKPIRTLEQLADMAGVSKGTMDSAKKLIKEADDETKEKLRAGKLSIYGAAQKLKDGSSNPTEETSSLEKRESVLPAKRPDLLPGYGLVKDLPPMKEGAYVRPPDSVYDIPPIAVYGNMPADDMERRGIAEIAHVKSDMNECMAYCVRKVSDIMRDMTTASVNEQNIDTLKQIVTSGYDEIISLLNKKLSGGK